MKPLKFKGHNVVIAKNQSEYLPLPAWISNDRQGLTVFCWKLALWERIALLFTGRLWHAVMTFKGPLQPQMLQVKRFRQVPKG